MNEKDSRPRFSADTLYEHLRALRDADKESLKVAFDASNKRLESIDDFRKAFETVVQATPTRTEMYSAIAANSGLLLAAIAAAMKW